MLPSGSLILQKFTLLFIRYCVLVSFLIFLSIFIYSAITLYKGCSEKMDFLKSFCDLSLASIGLMLVVQKQIGSPRCRGWITVNLKKYTSKIINDSFRFRLLMTLVGEVRSTDINTTNNAIPDNNSSIDIDFNSDMKELQEMSRLY